MKRIGITTEGNVMVEMSQNEMKQFSLLCEAIEGKPFFETFYHPDDRGVVDVDLSSVFGSIREWVKMKFHLNDIQRRINEMSENLLHLEKGKK